MREQNIKNRKNYSKQGSKKNVKKKNRIKEIYYV